MDQSALAVHEAAHAVLFYLLADIGGRNARKSVARIEMHHNSGACHYGPSKTVGTDVAWTVATVIEMMAGAAAEARLTGCDRYDAALRPECRGDLSLAVRHCLQAGLSLGQTELVIDRALDEACKVFDDPRYWRAVLAVAEKLPAEGTMSGRQIVHAIEAALREQHNSAWLRWWRQWRLSPETEAASLA